jgi:hypothetical protein
MPNKIRTEPEIFALKIDHSTAKINQDCLSKFHFEDPYQGSGDWGATTDFMFWFFLVGVLTIE